MDSRYLVPAVAGAFALAVCALIWGGGLAGAVEEPVEIPPPAIDEAPSGALETVVFAGGCFWGVQAVFQHVRGVESAVSGYAGGRGADPTYAEVSTGSTGYAETVEVTFDPSEVSYGALLQIFFSVVHDPTQRDRQGPDYGKQYRSAIFPTTEGQQRIAAAYIAQLDAAGVYRTPIVTEIAPLSTFYRAEDYHQDFATRHPEQSYIVWNDLPKVRALREMFPDVWRETPRLVLGPRASASLAHADTH